MRALAIKRWHVVYDLGYDGCDAIDVREER